MEFIQARLLGDVSEDDRGIVREAAGGDGAVLRILDGLMGSGGRDAHLISRGGLILLRPACDQQTWDEEKQEEKK